MVAVEDLEVDRRPIMDMHLVMNTGTGQATVLAMEVKAADQALKCGMIRIFGNRSV